MKLDHSFVLCMSYFHPLDRKMEAIIVMRRFENMGGEGLVMIRGVFRSPEQFMAGGWRRRSAAEGREMARFLERGESLSL